jgi:hypothetical protein
MVNNVFKKTEMEEILQKNCTNYLDHIIFMKIIMKDISNNSFKKITQESLPPRCVKISITNVSFLNKQQKSQSDADLEIWAEFSIPKEKGVVIGTAVYHLNFASETLFLENCYGTFFLPKSSN